MSELKPCPFCGGPAMIYPVAYWIVECTECEAEGPPAKSEDQAIELWNNRTPASEGEQK